MQFHMAGSHAGKEKLETSDVECVLTVPSDIVFPRTIYRFAHCNGLSIPLQQTLLAF